MENKLKPLSENDDTLVYRALCVFMDNSTFLIGYITRIEKEIRIKEYGKYNYYKINDFTHYQYVINPKGGFLII